MCQWPCCWGSRLTCSLLSFPKHFSLPLQKVSLPKHLSSSLFSSNSLPLRGARGFTVELGVGHQSRTHLRLGVGDPFSWLCPRLGVSAFAPLPETFWV